MKILKTKNDNLDEKIINEAINLLANGGVILYPTDTVYGLGANIFNNKAVRKVFDIKNRNFLKPLSILISNTESVDLVAEVSILQKKVLNKYLPGPYTFILNKSKIVPLYLTGGRSTVGVRVPKNDIACSLASLFPITTTSANISNKHVLNNPKDILKQLNCDVDLVIDVGSIETKASTIIDLTSNKMNYLKRE